MPVIGTVIRFFPDEGRMFGFVRLADGSELFFHYNDGCHAKEGEKTPEFDDRPTHWEPDPTVEVPRRRDQLILK